MKSNFRGLFSVQPLSARSQPASQAGFTLLEIIIVLGILGTLMTLLFGGIGSGNTKARIKETGVKVSNIQAKLLQYQSDVGSFPSTAEGLQALMTNPGASAKWGGPYVTVEDDIKDAWDTPLEYELAPKGNKLVSAGPDKQSGTEDDITYLNGREVNTSSAPTTGGSEGGQAN